MQVLQKIIYTDARGAEHNKYTSHTLRHSFAMHWLDNGGSMEALSKHLAHSSITTTEIYGEVREDRASKEYEEFAPDLNTDTSYQGGVCTLCNDRPSSVSHHTSYNPEETIDVCPSCHAEIHHTSKYEDLQPDMTLKQAKKEGYIN